MDLRALRNNRVALVERGAPNSLCLVESGKLLPGVKLIIANAESKGQCGESHLGEIWVIFDYFIISSLFIKYLIYFRFNHLTTLLDILRSMAMRQITMIISLLNLLLVQIQQRHGHELDIWAS